MNVRTYVKEQGTPRTRSQRNEQGQRSRCSRYLAFIPIILLFHGKKIMTMKQCRGPRLQGQIAEEVTQYDLKKQKVR